MYGMLDRTKLVVLALLVCSFFFSTVHTVAVPGPKGINSGGACSGSACSNKPGNGNGGAAGSSSSSVAIVPRATDTSSSTDSSDSANKGINSGGSCSGGACSGGGGAGGGGANDGAGDDNPGGSNNSTFAQCDVTTLAKWIGIRNDMQFNVFDCEHLSQRGRRALVLTSTDSDVWRPGEGSNTAGVPRRRHVLADAAGGGAAVWRS